MEWDASWGDPVADYNIDPARTELGGFKVGDRIRAVEDTDDGLFEGDEGEVVGIAHIKAGSHPMSAPTRDELVVVCEGMDPVGATPDQIEHE